MQISQLNYNIQNNRPSFTSYKNPIKSFDYPTPKGILHFYEINSGHSVKNSFCRNLEAFFLTNFANTSSHPYWKLLKDSNSIYFQDRLLEESQVIKSILRSKDSTVLLAKDKDKNIVAAILTKTLNESPTVKDTDTLYIDSIAVDPEYRGFSIGKMLIKKLLDSFSHRFSDAFLVAYKEVVPFYEKLGFKAMNYYKKPESRFLISEMAKERPDYPAFVEFMEIPLLKDCGMDWCSRVKRRNIPRY